nr:hypothetical protein [Tanacetum cinerariifolium]
MTSPFESKNELLRAMDSRLSELKEQLVDALNKAIDTSCSPNDISELKAEDIVPCRDQRLQEHELPCVGPSVSPNTRGAHQPNSLPSHDLRLHMPEVPATVMLQSISADGVNKHSDSISGHHDNTVQAAHTGTSSEWQSGIRQPVMSASTGSAHALLNMNTQSCIR